MSNIAYVTIKGSTQGDITSDATTADSIGNLWQEGHEGQCLVYKFEQNAIVPRDPQSGSIIATRRHMPTTFVKPLDKAVAEREAWRLAGELGIGLSTVRPHGVHGAWDATGTTAWMRWLTRLPVGLWLASTRFPSIYAGDLAEGICRILERPSAAGRAYNLANQPSAHTTWDMLRAYRDAGGPVGPVVVPLPVPITRQYDISRAEQDLDFENRPLVDGFRDMLAIEAAGGI